jgi:hypothetical protein
MDNIFDKLIRIIILQGLEYASARELSNELLQRLLKVHSLHRSIAEVNEQINWLEQRGYVNTTRMGEEGLITVKITRPGIDVALGNARADGIDSPYGV